jgi:hypothetical protein
VHSLSLTTLFAGNSLISCDDSGESPLPKLLSLMFHSGKMPTIGQAVLLSKNFQNSLGGQYGAGQLRLLVESATETGFLILMRFSVFLSCFTSFLFPFWRHHFNFLMRF